MAFNNPKNLLSLIKDQLQSHTGDFGYKELPTAADKYIDVSVKTKAVLLLKAFI